MRSSAGVPGVAPDVVVVGAGELAASDELRHECSDGFGVGLCALIAVLTMGTSIRWLGMLSETKTVGTSAAYQGISGPIGIDHLIRSAPCWAKSDTLAKINAASYFSA